MIVLTAGRFGEHVADALLKRIEHVNVLSIMDAATSLEPLVESHDFVAVALWRPYIAQCEIVDRICHASGTPWSIAQIMQNSLNCGPVVVPGVGPCFSCYHKRFLSHYRSSDREMAMRAAFENDPSLGIHGFTGPMVQIAVNALLEDSAAPVKRAGRLRAVDCLRSQVLETEVIGVHGCPTCRSKDALAPGRRFIEHLKPEIAQVLV